MRDQNLALINQQKQKRDMDRSYELQQSGTTPASIGDGYQRQLAAMQEGERQKSVVMQKYANDIGSPARQKQLHE